MKTWECLLPIPPVAWQRPRISRFGRLITAEKPRAATKAMKDLLGLKKAPIFDGPLALTVVFYLEKPKSVPKKRLYPTVRPDLDNYLKLVLDAANGILYLDDAQIVTLETSKRYADMAAIEIKVTEYADDVSRSRQ